MCFFAVEEREKKDASFLYPNERLNVSIIFTFVPLEKKKNVPKKIFVLFRGPVSVMYAMKELMSRTKELERKKRRKKIEKKRLHCFGEEKKKNINEPRVFVGVYLIEGGKKN